MYKSRLLIWTGPLYAVLLLASDFAFGDQPGEKASAAQVVRYFDGHRGRTMTEAFVAPALAALLVLFAGELRSRARARTAGAGPTIMFGGAVLVAAGALIGAMLDLALVSSAQHHQPQVAQTLNVVSNADWLPFIGGLAVFLVGAGITVLRTGLLPGWLGWVALVAGLVSLGGPGGISGYFVMPTWIIVAGALLGLRAGSDAAALPSEPVAPQPMTGRTR
jgi:hypothetical protein